MNISIKVVRVICCLVFTFQVGIGTEAATLQSSSNAQQQAIATANTPGFVLEDGTPVKVRFAQTVSSESAHVDDRVEFEVLEEVKIADVIVIPKGGIAWGTVTEAQPKRRMARGGKLEIVLDSARLVDGQRAALRATKEVKGGGHTGAMTAGIVATGLILWPAAPFFLFMHGKEITIPKGTEVPTFVNGNFPLDMAKFQPTAPVDRQQVNSAQPSLSAQNSSNAEIDVTSTPAGAEIELDGAFVGSTPSSMGVPSGYHTVTVKKSGFKPWERNIKVTSGKIEIAADLEASGGTRTQPAK
jgi:hypothetical protein